MPIPTNVDPFRFLAASVGIKLKEPLSLQTLRSAMLALADIVGIERKDVQAFERRALSFVRTELPRQLKSPSVALDLDVHSAAINSQVKRWVDSVDPARMREIGARLDSWIEARLVISADDLILLQHYVYSEWMMRMNPDKFTRELARRAQVLNYMVLERHPEAFRRAFTHWQPIADPETHQGRSDLQAQGQIWHGMMTSSTAKAAGSRKRASLLELLKAWVTAFENTIANSCAFLWMATCENNTPNGLSSLPRDPKGEVKKGDVYNRLVTWFKQAGLDFPFHARLVKIRNSVVHGPFLFDDDREVITFGKPGANSTVELSFQEVEFHAEQDVLLASQFLTGVFSAILEYDNRRGRFDEAWRRFEVALDGANAILDHRLPHDDPFGIEFNEMPEAPMRSPFALPSH